MKKVSEWLKEHTDSHSIFDDTKLRESFKTETGHDAPWQSHSMELTRQAIRARGLGGTLEGADGMRCSYGYEIASACAVQFADFHSQKMGRGFLWRDCLEALERRGL